MTTYRNAEEAFEQAIACGRLSEDETSPAYAGLYMYMGTETSADGHKRDMFKNCDTRQYI